MHIFHIQWSYDMSKHRNEHKLDQKQYSKLTWQYPPHNPPTWPQSSQRVYNPMPIHSFQLPICIRILCWCWSRCWRGWDFRCRMRLWMWGLLAVRGWGRGGGWSVVVMLLEPSWHYCISAEDDIFHLSREISSRKTVFLIFNFWIFILDKTSG